MLQGFFDYCDDRVGAVHTGGRKGWLAAFRDAALFKTIYGWGLRRREAAMLELADLSGNAHAPEFRAVRCGVGAVRQGDEGFSAAAADGVDHDGLGGRGEQIRRDYGPVGPALWPTERGARISTDHINLRFAAYRDAVGLPVELGPHCLRHSYITHLLERRLRPFICSAAGRAFVGVDHRGVHNDRQRLQETGGCAVPWTVHSQTRPGISG
jgi:integrase/recombinase XerC